jgi:hypothetical protein
MALAHPRCWGPHRRFWSVRNSSGYGIWIAGINHRDSVYLVRLDYPVWGLTWAFAACVVG